MDRYDCYLFGTLNISVFIKYKQWGEPKYKTFLIPPNTYTNQNSEDGYKLEIDFKAYRLCNQAYIYYQ